MIRNGIDTSEYAPLDPAVGQRVERHGIDPARPYVIFVGRITRQKGVPVLLRAAAQLDPAAQLVPCACEADTPELLKEVTGLVDGLRASRSGVVWIPEMLPKHDVIQLLTHATVFACPSLYEPLGIVNLGGDGVRHGRGRLPGRWHPGGRRGRPDRPAGPAGRPSGAGRGAEHAGAGPRPGRGDGPGRPRTYRGRVRLAGDRRADRRAYGPNPASASSG